MDEKIKDPKIEQEVLLVKEPYDEKLKVVSGMDENGKLKTAPAKQENEPDFLKIDKHSNVLENFFSNFMRQVKEPTHFGFFKVPASDVENKAAELGEMLKNPEDPTSKQALDAARINPEDYAKLTGLGEGYKPLDPERIDWSLLEKVGVTRESLEKSGALEAMLNYRKTPDLIPLSIKIGDTMTVRTEARLSLRQDENGNITPITHTIQAKPQLEKEFFGYKFTAEDKKQLSETGHLGHSVELKIPGRDNPMKALISIDKLTNDIVALDASKVRIPNEIKGVALSDKQKQELSEGKGVYVEGMTAKSGKPFNATLQFNADKRGLDFQFSNTPKQAQQQRQEDGNKPSQANENRTLRVPDKLLGRDVSEQEATKLKEGATVYMEGLKDKQGQPFNAYVKANFEKGKFDFYKWNPEKAQSQTKEVTPDNASKTQVAVNSEGKSNEATKQVHDPLQKGQTQPTPAQKEEIKQNHEEPKKRSGMRL